MPRGLNYRDHPRYIEVYKDGKKIADNWGPDGRGYNDLQALIRAKVSIIKLLGIIPPTSCRVATDYKKGNILIKIQISDPYAV